MDGVAGLNQPAIAPDETFVYEFTLRQHGTQMYHPHADEMTQMALGMMGMFVIHPRDGEAVAVERVYAILLPNREPHPGTARPAPPDRTSVVEGTSVTVRVGRGGLLVNQKKRESK